MANTAKQQTQVCFAADEGIGRCNVVADIRLPFGPFQKRQRSSIYKPCAKAEALVLRNKTPVGRLLAALTYDLVKWNHLFVERDENMWEASATVCSLKIKSLSSMHKVQMLCKTALV